VVFDRPTYRKLIHNHITKVLTMPPSVLVQLQHGAFASSITDRAAHCEALDEVHEMKINKHAKSLVVRPIDRRPKLNAHLTGGPNSMPTYEPKCDE